MEEENEEWKIRFLNLPCDEQLHFVQKVALDEKLEKKFKDWLKNKSV